MAFSNKFARAALTPIFSAPAMGWLPTKYAPALRASGSSFCATVSLTLPTSVKMAPGFNLVSICRVKASICAIGVQRMTKSASSTARAKSRVA